MKQSPIIAVLVAALAGSCSGGGDSSIPADAVAAVGGSVLTTAEVAANVPPMLAPDDSATMARAYVRRWVDARLVSDVAASDIDMEQIDRLTEEYRLELIMDSYRRIMASRADAAEFGIDSLKAYYNAHADEFVLERPLVKGIYLKVADQAPQLPRLRRLYRSDRPVDLDQLEKEATGAIHYDYFRDRWVDWEQIETRIPYDFASGADSFLRSGRPLEVSAGGFTYLLCISEYIGAGSAMPFEAARPLVRERLLNARRRQFDVVLLNGLRQRALERGILVFPAGNPLE
ncbi:MAG: peptidyl-prolyl cis-trans isomerase [Muribaculaceae bacterium]